MPNKKKPPAAARLGKYATGIEAANQIVGAAMNVFINEGYASLSLRKIADNCGMKVGNLSYYFPTKNLLITEMLEMMLLDFRSTSDQIYGDPALNPEQKLQRILRFWLEDMQSKRGTNLYTELWAMANHDPFVAARLDEFYRRGQERFGTLIRALNPSLSDEQVMVVSAYVSSAMEGVIIFAGHNRPWARQLPQLAALSIASLTSLIKTIKPEEIDSLKDSWRFPEAP